MRLDSNQAGKLRTVLQQGLDKSEGPDARRTQLEKNLVKAAEQCRQHGITEVDDFVRAVKQAIGGGQLAAKAKREIVEAMTGMSLSSVKKNLGQALDARTLVANRGAPVLEALLDLGAVTAPGAPTAKGAERRQQLETIAAAYKPAATAGLFDSIGDVGAGVVNEKKGTISWTLADSNGEGKLGQFMYFTLGEHSLDFDVLPGTKQARKGKLYIESAGLEEIANLTSWLEAVPDSPVKTAALERLGKRADEVRSMAKTALEIGEGVAAGGLSAWSSFQILCGNNYYMDVPNLRAHGIEPALSRHIGLLAALSRESGHLVAYGTKAADTAEALMELASRGSYVSSLLKPSDGEKGKKNELPSIVRSVLAQNGPMPTTRVAPLADARAERFMQAWEGKPLDWAALEQHGISRSEYGSSKIGAESFYSSSLDTASLRQLIGWIEAKLQAGLTDPGVTGSPLLLAEFARDMKGAHAELKTAREELARREAHSEATSKAVASHAEALLARPPSADEHRKIADYFASDYPSSVALSDAKLTKGGMPEHLWPAVRAQAVLAEISPAALARLATLDDVAEILTTAIESKPSAAAGLRPDEKGGGDKVPWAKEAPAPKAISAAVQRAAQRVVPSRFEAHKEVELARLITEMGAVKQASYGGERGGLVIESDTAKLSFHKNPGIINFKPNDHTYTSGMRAETLDDFEALLIAAKATQTQPQAAHPLVAARLEAGSAWGAIERELLAIVGQRRELAALGQRWVAALERFQELPAAALDSAVRDQALLGTAATTWGGYYYAGTETFTKELGAAGAEAVKYQLALSDPGLFAFVESGGAEGSLRSEVLSFLERQDDPNFRDWEWRRASDVRGDIGTVLRAVQSKPKPEVAVPAAEGTGAKVSKAEADRLEVDVGGVTLRVLYVLGDLVVRGQKKPPRDDSKLLQDNKDSFAKQIEIAGVLMAFDDNIDGLDESSARALHAAVDEALRAGEPSKPSDDPALSAARELHSGRLMMRATRYRLASRLAKLST